MKRRTKQLAAVAKIRRDEDDASPESLKDKQEVRGLDSDLSLFDLTDLFNAYYSYHNSNGIFTYDHITGVNIRNRSLRSETRTLSRYEALRRIEGLRLGSRPFKQNEVAEHRPNFSLGYFGLLMKYLTLPYKAFFTDGNYLKIRVDKKLYDAMELNDEELQELRLAAANNPNLVNNAMISDDVSDRFLEILRTSKKMRDIENRMPLRVAQDGLVAYLHNPFDWQPETVHALDLVTEPQAECCPDTWSNFFVIRKISAYEAVKRINSPGRNWNPDALRWALEASLGEDHLLSSYTHHSYFGDVLRDDRACGENYMVQSFYKDKSQRVNNIAGYYGSMTVIEGYYVNTDGKINKVIFFPSTTVKDAGQDIRKAHREGALDEGDPLENADILFFQKNAFSKMSEAITVVPFSQDEPSLERQRAYGHELFSPVEAIMRLDSSILNFAILMGIPFVKSRNQGTDGQDIEDLEINGDFTDIGDRDFAPTHFTADLNSMLAVRNMLLQHAMAKAFLGGLDGAEMTANGRGANLANLRLVRDGRVHKHAIEDFADGVRDLYTQVFRKVLDAREDAEKNHQLLEKRFFKYLTQLLGHPETLFEIDKEDILDDTGLPYWLSIEAVRNGASHFGAAEMILYSEIKNIFGDGLDQRALQQLNRMGIQSILGSQDALDILGDPREANVTDREQVYDAVLENAAILGSVDSSALNFEQVPILPDKDDHIAHLSQVHLPKMQEIIELLQRAEGFSPADLAAMSENELDSRVDLILKVAALANHAAQHQQALSLFGKRRDDVNRLREEANNILQAAEGLLNGMQMHLRALQQKRQENMQRLQNISPENEAEKQKAEVEMLKIQAKMQADEQKLLLANKIADQRQAQHVDQQVSKARDRALKRDIAAQDAALRQQEMFIQQPGQTDLEGS